MIQLIRMAIRDLGRNRRRTFFSALALGMGLALLILIASVYRGEMRDSLNTSIKLQTGHLQLRANGYDETKSSLSWKNLIENPEQVATQIARLSQVKTATPRLYASGIIGTGDQTAGVRVVGVDPPSPANDPFREGLLSGTFLQSDDRNGILVGSTLADKLRLKAGDNVDLLINTSNGDVNEQAFTIRGTFTTHTPGFDEGTILMPLAKAQTITSTDNHASIIFILLKNIDETIPVLKAITSSTYMVKTYLQLNELLVQTEQLANGFMLVIYLIVLAVSATVIVNTFIMSVYERTREIGILTAIGMKASRVLAMFFAESSILGVGGIAIGLILGGIAAFFIQRYGIYVGNIGATGIMIGERIYGYLTVNDVVTVTVMAFITSLLAALYPALMAARMEPVQALHGGN